MKAGSFSMCCCISCSLIHPHGQWRSEGGQDRVSRLGNSEGGRGNSQLSFFGAALKEPVVGQAGDEQDKV